MQSETFEKFRALIYGASGIALSSEKVGLLNTRIQKRIRELQLSDASQYLEIIESDLSGQELVTLLDCISTNTTYFYREPKHFETYRSILENLSKQGKRDFKIWCAAASTGEEPYVLAMESLETLDSRHNKFRILATDISTRVLKRATDGVYTVESLEKVPEDLRERYFMPVSYNGKTLFKAKKTLSDLLLFKRLNLVEFPYPLKGPIDVIFCRNVMIYFDVETRAKIIQEFYRLLASPGFLFLSHSESLLGVQHSFKRFDTSVFLKE